MSGKFIPATEATRETLDWGSLGWCSRPADTGTKGLIVIEVTLAPGGDEKKPIRQSSRLGGK